MVGREHKLAVAKRNLRVDDVRVPLSEIWEAYASDPVRRRELRPRSFENYQSDFRMIVHDLGATYADEVTPDAVKTLREKAVAGGTSNATIKRKEAALKAVLNWAVEQKMLDANPLGKLKPPKHCPVRQRRDLDQAELEALFDCCPEWRYPLWLTFASTGLRSNEVSSMRVEWVDLRRGEVTIPKEISKNGKLKTVPLPDEVLKWIGAQKKQPDERVFTTLAGRPLNKVTIRRWLRKDLSAARIPVETARGIVDVHSFRVTAISRLIESGVDPKLVMELVGHSSLKMTMEVYARVANERKHAAVKNLSYVKRGRHSNVVKLKNALA